jgi:membrane associated rhomboid family serine protease
MRNLPTVVKNLIIINILVMIMMALNEELMVEHFALYFPASPFFRIWQIFTHLFMHGGFAHIFFNMYSLFIFGSVLERVWGPKKFLLFYLVTGVGAALVHSGVQWIVYSNALSDANLTFAQASFLAEPIAAKVRAGATFVPAWSTTLFTPTIGASGAIYGVLMGYGMLYPDSRLSLLFPPVTLKAKWFVLIFAGIELLLGIFATGSGVAHFAHLGGLIFGFLLIMYWKRRHTLYSRMD